MNKFLSGKVPTEVVEMRKAKRSRLKKKREIDREIDLNVASDHADYMHVGDRLSGRISLATLDLSSIEEAPLLDEGALYQLTFTALYIPKGEIEKLYDSIEKDFVGMINLGHEQFESNPLFGDVGRWSKEDLRLVDIEDGRQRIMATPNLFMDMSIMQDLKSKNMSYGLSAELSFTISGFVNTEEEFGIPLAKDLEMTRFAIVGDTGNPSSANTINLSKEGVMSKKADKKLKLEDKTPETVLLDGKEVAVEEVEAPVEPDTKDEDTKVEETEGEKALSKAKAELAVLEAEDEEKETAELSVVLKERDELKMELSVAQRNAEAYKEEARLHRENWVQLAKMGVSVPKSKVKASSVEDEKASKQPTNADMIKASLQGKDS